jgi:flagellin
MSLNSINTNVGAMIALQNLNNTASELKTSENRISTGRRVDTAKDNGAIWAIAQGQRSQSQSLDAVKDSLRRGQSISDVALAAGSTISDLLNGMKEKALAASDTTLTTASVTALNEDFKALRDQITKAVTNATFDGANLIKSGGASIGALASADGTSKITISAVSLALGGSTITVGATASFATAAAAAALVTTVESSITNLNGAMAKIGTKAKSLDTYLTFTGKLQDSLDNGIGNLVDAALAKERARLQALQAKQQLGVQSLSIANQSTAILQSLFR